jgi:hypothetical protein
MWIKELLAGHRDRMRQNMGMPKGVFQKLAHTLAAKITLCDSKHVKLEEALGIFLHMLVTNNTTEEEHEWFQRSPDTIHRCMHFYAINCISLLTMSSHFHRVLNAIFSPAFRDSYLRMPTRDTQPSPHITDNLKFSPFFDDARGALDGTHIGTFPADDARNSRFHNHKVFLSTNMQAAVDFEQQYIYLLTGWEGSASDSAIVNVACQSDLAIPVGKYFLADAGHPPCDALLVPYRGKCYHLHEWGEAGERFALFFVAKFLADIPFRPQDHEELFNLRHSQLRNIIERAFGATKKKFKMFRQPSNFSVPCGNRTG